MKPIAGVTLAFGTANIPDDLFFLNVADGDSWRRMPNG
jgi:hypothetical protein